MIIRIIQGEFSQCRCPFFIATSLHKYGRITVEEVCHLFCLPLSVCSESPTFRVSMWDGSGQRLLIPMETESDSCLVSQPPLQLEHGHVWPRPGQSVAPMSNSILELVRQQGREWKLSLSLSPPLPLSLSLSGDSWKWWLQGQVPGTELVYILAVGTAAIKSSSWCKRST